MPIRINRRVPFHISGKELMRFYNGGHISKKKLTPFISKFEPAFNRDKIRNAFHEIYLEKIQFIKENKVVNESPYYFDLSGECAIGEFPEIMVFYSYFWGNFNVLNSNYRRIELPQFVLPYKGSIQDYDENFFVINNGKINIIIKTSDIKRIVGFLNNFYVDLGEYVLRCRHPGTPYPMVEYRKKEFMENMKIIGSGTYYPYEYKPYFHKVLRLNIKSEIFIIL